MDIEAQQIPREHIRIPGDEKFYSVTPYFQHLNWLDENQSEQQGKPVYKVIEVCQIRFAGDRNYSPIVPVDSMFRKMGLTEISYAEQWSEQYRSFLQGDAQIAEGTPLEELTIYGITPSQLSLCRALKIYTVEALYHLEGANRKNLSSHANTLKPMADTFMEARRTGNDQSKRIAELEEKLAAMSVAISEKEASPDEVDKALYEAMTGDELRDMIFEKTGAKPDGRLGHEALVNMAKGM